MVGGSLYAKAVKSLWQGKCTISKQTNEMNEKKGRTEIKEVDLYTDEPCRISFNTVKTTDPVDNAAQEAQSITLFIDKAIDVPVGSKITVVQNGVCGVYEKSGKPAVYSYHQEIPLDLFKGWA